MPDRLSQAIVRNPVNQAAMNLLGSMAFLLTGLLLGVVFAWLALRNSAERAVIDAQVESLVERTTLNAQLQDRQDRNDELHAEIVRLDARLNELRHDLLQEGTRRAVAEVQAERVPDLETELGDVRSLLDLSRGKIASLSAREAELATMLAQERKTAAEKLELLDDARQKLSDVFSALSSEALRQNNQSFLDLARTALEKDQDSVPDELHFRQQNIAENAQQISRPGRELSERLITMTEHLMKLGNSLSGSVEAYNKAVGSLESRVLVTVRKFKEPDPVLPEAEISEIIPIEIRPRELPAPEAANDKIASESGDE